MKNDNRPPKGRRSYPAFYEKLIPIALIIIAIGTVAAILFALAVALRLLPGITP